jgi:hypothetical protein
MAAGPKRPTAGNTWLGVVKHPSTGIRIPELLLPGILAAYRRREAAGELSLSFGRETAPERVIRAKPGAWEITRGHTGTSIKKYMTMGAREAEKAGVTVEIEADHLIIIGSQAAALQRIAGHHVESHISPEELETSLDYYRMCIDEAAEVGVMGCLTIDASDLFWLEADRLSSSRVRKLFAQRYSPAGARKLLGRYRDRFRFRAPGGKRVRVTITELQAMRLALKFQDSLDASAELYRYCRGRLGHGRFSVEIALDETARVTSPRETLFYLTEWKAMRLPCHYVGPNVGFAKRVDYTGDLATLERRVRQQHAIAQGVCGALLSIHSGEGSTPYSGKGKGSYEALLAGTGGDLKFKISDVYYELLMEMLAALPARSEGRRLYERIFDGVLALLRDEVRSQGPLVTPLLVQQLEDHDRRIKRDPGSRYDPRAQFFRFNAYLALNMRDDRGRRCFRDALVRYVKGDRAFRAKLDQEVEALTLRMIDGLNLGDNLQVAEP